MEQFGVTATEVEAGMKYWQDYTRVYGGYGRYKRCDASHFPGWSVDQCAYDVWEPTGPDHVRVKAHGRFSHLVATYSQSANFVAYSNNWWTYSCAIYNGTLPPLWHYECAGGRSGPF